MFSRAGDYDKRGRESEDSHCFYGYGVEYIAVIEADVVPIEVLSMPIQRANVEVAGTLQPIVRSDIV